MFIISKSCKNKSSYMMDMHYALGLFSRDWASNIPTSLPLEIFPTLKDAETFILGQLPASVDIPDNGIVTIVSINTNGTIDRLVKTIDVTTIATHIGTISAGTVKQQDGVYSSPEDTLKAYRSGKFVDWKALANRGK